MLLLHRRISLLFIGVFVTLLSLTAQPVDLDRYDWQTEKITRGLYWRSLQTEQLLGGPQHINILRVRTNKQEVDLVFSTDSLQRPSTFGERHDALAAVNGGFFNTLGTESVTFLKADGKIISGNSAELESADSELLEGALVITDRGRVLIEPVRPETFYELSGEFRDVLVTGPLLIVDGAPSALEENPFNDNRHPRTCACKTKKKELLLITVDGRNARAQGMSLDELTRLLLALGCDEAVNLDGGGSTTLWIDGRSDNGVVNRPSDNGLFDNKGERKVANVILIR